MARILVIEDHETTSDVIAIYLQREGHEVVLVQNGLDGLEKARSNYFDLLILDIMLPKIDGRELCRRLRQESDLPIIMLTALSTEKDVVQGFQLGANDYVTKPFSPNELMARVNAHIRRLEPLHRHELILNDICLDRVQHSVSKRGERLPLTRTEFRILETLMLAPGKVFTREDIISKALGYDYVGSSKNIDIHISNIRKRIESDRANPKLILTVIGVGYRVPAQTDSND